MSDKAPEASQRDAVRHPMGQMLLLGIILGALHYALMRIIGMKIPFNIFVPWLLCSSIVAMMVGAWVYHRRKASGRSTRATLPLWGYAVLVIAVAVNLKAPTLYWANILFGGIDLPVLEPTWVELHVAAEIVFVLMIPVVYYGLGLIFARAYEAVASPHRAYGLHLLAFAVGGVGAYLVLGAWGMMPLLVGVGALFAAFLLPSRTLIVGFMALLTLTGAVSHAAPDKFFMWSVREHEPIRETVWSPYYKLDFHHFGDQCVATISNNYLLYYTCEDPVYDHLQRREVFKVLAPGRDRFLVVGASGGVSMQTFRKSNPDFELGVGIEVDPATVDMALGQIRDYNGDIFHDPRVKLIKAEGREFLERTRQRYDLIYLDGVDNRQFMLPMSSVSVESYLFTKEGMSCLMDSLTNDGVLLIDVGGTANDSAIPFVAALEGLGHYDLYWYIVSDYPMVGLPLFFIFASRNPEAIERLRPELSKINAIERVERPCFEKGCTGDGYVAATDDRPFLYPYSGGVRAAGWLPVVVMLVFVRWLLRRVRRREPDDPGLPLYPLFIALGGVYGATESVLVLQGSRRFFDPALASTLLISLFLVGGALANFLHARWAPAFGHKVAAMVTVLLAVSFSLSPLASAAFLFLPLALMGGFGLGWLWPRAISWLPAERRALALAMNGAGVLVGVFATQWIFAAYGLTPLKYVTLAVCAALCWGYLRHARRLEESSTGAVQM